KAELLLCCVIDPVHFRSNSSVQPRYMFGDGFSDGAQLDASSFQTPADRLPNQRVGCGLQVKHRDRLDQVRLSPGPHCLVPFALVNSSRNKQDWRVGVELSNLSAKRNTISIGQPGIKHIEVDKTGFSLPQSLGHGY